MRKIFFYLGVALLATGCSDQAEVGTLHGQLEDMGANDSVVIFCDGVKDTIAAPNGAFCYQYTDSMAHILRVMNYAKGPNAPRVSPITVMMMPGTEVHLTGSFNHHEVEGGKFYKEYNAMYQQIKAVDIKRKAANASYMALVNLKAAKADIMSSFEKLKAVDKEYQAHLEGYIAGHLNSPVSLYLLANVHPNYGEKYIMDFTEEVKQGVTKDMYDATLAYYEKSIAKKQAIENIQPGKMAPDFTAKDVKGNDFTLSSLRGKYVVLDFWGSWCGWCIAGFPEMKKLYQQYRDRIEFVGIGCRDTEEKWKAAVEKHELPWINVFNPAKDFRSDLTTVYNVSGYPTKVIISPEGKILQVVLGEDREFYDSIRFLLTD